MTGTGIILQARLGSRRLPGKVLAPIGSRTILDHCVTRLSTSGLPVIVATTDQPEDDAVERAARRLGVDVFRGAEDDVLGRYIAAAHACGLTEIIRATADNPLVDSGAPMRTLTFRQRVGADHVVECGLPAGTAVEAVSIDALERASALITDPYDREHVTSFLRRDSRFRALRAVAPGDLRRPGLRLTVDTPEDLEFIREVYASLDTGHDIPALTAVIKAADALLVRHVAQKRIRQGA
jgi:spore coat polysaccharide biosynthesis protein SpsF (cytidylyltransferase family)